MRRGATAKGMARLAACWLLTGCSLDWSYRAGPDAQGNRDASSDAGGARDAADGEPTPGDSGLECRANGDCATGTLCHFADHLCGRGQTGRCRAPRTACGSAPAVCGCDGIVDGDECAANGRGQDTSTDATCNTPGFRYRCGDSFCITGTPFSQFCVRRTGTSEQVYACENSFDFQCAEVSCGADAGCAFHGCTCTPLSGGGLLDCP